MALKTKYSMYLIVSKKNTLEYHWFRKRGLRFFLYLVWFGLTADEIGTVKEMRF